MLILIKHILKTNKFCINRTSFLCSLERSLSYTIDNILDAVDEKKNCFWTDFFFVHKRTGLHFSCVRSVQLCVLIFYSCYFLIFICHRSTSWEVLHERVLIFVLYVCKFILYHTIEKSRHHSDKRSYWLN